MFGQKVVNIYIRDNGIVVTDEEGVDLRVHDERKHNTNHYPTAEQARQIEPEIRDDLVDTVVTKTLKSVTTAARSGNDTACIEWGFHPDPLNEAEKDKIRKVLEQIGYKTSTNLVSW